MILFHSFRLVAGGLGRGTSGWLADLKLQNSKIVPDADELVTEHRVFINYHTGTQIQN